MALKFSPLTRALVICLALVWPTASAGLAAGEGDRHDLARRARALLSDRCVHCHGPDEESREADLRLDVEEEVRTVVDPDTPDDSELTLRITSDDPDTVMPPHDSGRTLEQEEIALLREWVRAGAPWAAHWSFVAPVRPAPQATPAAPWVRNPIDRFVLARLKQAGLSPSPQADRHTLARRVAFDLTGLPPAPELVDRFLADTSPQAWERLVDGLLASEHFGERMAMVWLDAARYSDTDGFQADATRNNWPWRDWVVAAYNANMPFDQFTIEQFAGDQLPAATPDQILATCFHRNHMTNGEGGRDPEESRVDYVIDRVNTMGTVWLGLTLGCCQCHSHKYDPISHAEYYRLNAFFNSIDEDGRAGGKAGPFLKYTPRHVQPGLEDSEHWLQQREEQLQAITARRLRAFPAWLEQQRKRLGATTDFRSWHQWPPITMATTGGTTLIERDGAFEIQGTDPRHDDYIIALRPQSPVTAIRLRVLPSPRAQGRLSRFSDGHIILTNLKVRLRSADGTRERDIAIRQAVATYQAAKSGRVYGPVATVLDDDPRTGWMTTGTAPDQGQSAAFVLAEPLSFAPGEELIVELRQRSLRGHSNLQRFTLEFTDETGPGASALAETPFEHLARLIREGGGTANVPADLRSTLEKDFLSGQPDVLEARRHVEKARKRRDRYRGARGARNVMVLRDRKEPRTTHVLVRGIWNNKGEEVAVGTPEIFTHAREKPVETRRQLAQWLVHRDNPLTARVAVNRYWQMYFGAGLVRTPADFGTQGEAPTHPELLDWLAVEFMDSGWDIKHLQKLIVTSATYRQRSDLSEDLRQRDPENRLLGRASRFRLPSWMIRDNALAASGLLSRRVGGPPVYPFQPVGAWLDATMGRFRYETSVGSDLYRRSLYSFWRRSVAPTGMFDAAPRRTCEVRTVRTNTPLHALILMNDQTFVEAARVLADQALQTADSNSERFHYLFRHVLSRRGTAAEIAILQDQLAAHLRDFAADQESARKLVAVGQSQSLTGETTQLAAWTMVANTVFNLDEAITRE